MPGHRFSRTTTFRNGCCVTRISTKIVEIFFNLPEYVKKKNVQDCGKICTVKFIWGFMVWFSTYFYTLSQKKNGTIKKKSLVTLNGCWWDTCMFSLPFSGRWSKKSLREALIWRGNLYIMETKKIAILKRKPQDFFSSTSESIVLYCSDN